MEKFIMTAVDFGILYVALRIFRASKSAAFSITASLLAIRSALNCAVLLAQWRAGVAWGTRHFIDMYWLDFWLSFSLLLFAVLVSWWAGAASRPTRWIMLTGCSIWLGVAIFVAVVPWIA